MTTGGVTVAARDMEAMFMHGSGVARDEAKALKPYVDAANGGHAEASMLLKQ